MTGKKNYFFIWDKKMLRKHEFIDQISVKNNKTNSNITYDSYFKIADRAILFNSMIFVAVILFNNKTE